MKLSQLISVLEDAKKREGDKYIWSIEDLDFPCPQEFTLELTDTLKRTDHGMSGGKVDNTKEIEVSLEYEGGVDVLYQDIRDRD